MAWYEQILRSPVDGADLRKEGESSFVSPDGTTYAYADGLYNFLPKASNNFHKTEEAFWNYAYEHEGERRLDNRSAPFHEHFRQPLISLPRGSHILEIACGNRADALEIALAGQQVIETDISVKGLHFARQLAQKMGVAQQVQFMLAEAEHLPFADNSFDGVLIAAAFHHLANPQQGLLEMKRVTRSGGYVVLGVEPAAWPYKTVYRLLSPLKKYIRRKRQRALNSIADDSTQGFSRRQLQKLAEECSLEIIELKPVKYSLELYDSYLRLKGRLFSVSAQPSKRIQQVLMKLDNILSRVPLIKNLSWHWNIIIRVNK